LFNKLLAFVIAAAITVLACFALGVFDGDGIVQVDAKDFEEFIFSGYLRGGLFDGPGSVYFYEGERFNGYFSGGRFNGRGAFFSANNEWSFSGVFQYGEISGGTLSTDSGEAVSLERSDAADMLVSDVWLYDGNFNDRGQTGDGTFVFADGSVYTGGFLDGLADGDGMFTDPSGRVVYQGGFRKGMFDGQGTYWSADGWTYYGGFNSGSFHGEGAVTIEGETIRGIWEMGVQTARYE
jgi:hypothetical protein